MRDHIIRRFSQFSWIIVLSLSLTLAVTGQSASSASQSSGHEVKPKAKEADEIELALAATGAGSAAEMKKRLFTHNITVFNEEFCAQAVAALPASLHKRRITQGKLLNRVESIFRQTLQSHGRSGKLDLFLFQDDVPSAMLWRGCVLALSDGLADPLYDGELAGIIAHELGHSYFEDEMVAAHRAQDARAMRVVELKCDAVAILSLDLLNYDSSLYLRGLQRIQVIIKRKGRSSGIFQSHPELVARAQFSQRFIKSLGGRLVFMSSLGESCQLADSTSLDFAEPILERLSISFFDHAPKYQHQSIGGLDYRPLL